MLLPMPALAPFSKAGGILASSLLTGLVSYWKLDEASGARADSLSVNNLMSNNNVGQAAGIISNAATFVRASTQTLSITDAAQAGLDPRASDFSFSFWLYSTLLDGNNHTAIGKGAGGVDEGYWIFESSGFLNVQFEHPVGTRIAPFEPGAVGSISLNTWTHFMVICNRAANLEIYRNNTLTKSQSMATVTGDCNGAAAFRLGGFNAAAHCFDGRLDEIGVWSRALTAGERAQLYNGGAGVTYPAFT